MFLDLVECWACHLSKTAWKEKAMSLIGTYLSIGQSSLEFVENVRDVPIVPSKERTQIGREVLESRNTLRR